jgi:hypothetical protein
MIGQDAFYVERMSTTTENVPKCINLFAGRQIAIFYDGNFKVIYINLYLSYSNTYI